MVSANTTRAKAVTTDSAGLHVASTSGFTEIEWIDAEGTIHGARLDTVDSSLAFETNIPTREGVQYKNRLNRHVLHYWAPTESHVWCESGFEQQCLNSLEFEAEVEVIAAQPFRILFAGTTPLRSHDPDFFGRRPDGRGVVYDVKPLRNHTERVQRQFAETAAICELIGWDYVVLDEVDPVRVRNLSNLRPSRFSRVHPNEGTYEQVLNIFDGGRTLGEGRSMLNMQLPVVAMPTIKHMLWHRMLRADLDSPLSFDTVVTTDREVAPCCDNE